MQKLRFRWTEYLTKVGPHIQSAKEEKFKVGQPNLVPPPNLSTQSYEGQVPSSHLSYSRYTLRGLHAGVVWLFLFV